MLNNLKHLFGNLSDSYYGGYCIGASKIKAKHARSVTGVGWDFLEPLLYVIIFSSLHSASVFTLEGSEIPYVLYLVTGILTFQTFSEAFLDATNYLPSMAALCQKIKVNSGHILISLMTISGYKLAIRIIIVTVILAYFDYFTISGYAIIVASWISLWLLSLGAGLVFAPFNCLFRDIGIGFGLLMRPLLFLSGAIFPMPKEGTLHIISTLNPPAIYINNVRLAVIAHPSYSFALYSFIIAILTFVMGWYVIHQTFSQAVERA